jgi:hypothetical protein
MVCATSGLSYAGFGVSTKFVHAPRSKTLFVGFACFRDFCYLKPNGHDNTWELSKPKTGMHLDANLKGLIHGQFEKRNMFCHSHRTKRRWLTKSTNVRKINFGDISKVEVLI